MMEAYKPYNAAPGLLSPVAKRLLILVGVLVLLIAAIFSVTRIISDREFRIVTVTPSKTLPTSTKTIVVDFNRELAPQEEQNNGYLRLVPDLERSVVIREKTLTITLLESVDADKTLTMMFTNLKAQDGSMLTTEPSLQAAYVPFGELPDEERERQAQAVGRPQDKHPLLEELPYDAISFRVDYEPDPKLFGTANSWQEEKENFVVVVNTFALRSGSTEEEYRQKTLAIRALALEWIEEQGVDPVNDIYIIYSPGDEELSGVVDDFTGDGAPPEDR